MSKRALALYMRGIKEQRLGGRAGAPVLLKALLKAAAFPSSDCAKFAKYH